MRLGPELSHESNIEFHFSYGLNLIISTEGQLLASNPRSFRTPYKNPSLSRGNLQSRPQSSCLLRMTEGHVQPLESRE